MTFITYVDDSNGSQRVSYPLPAQDNMDRLKPMMGQQQQQQQLQDKRSKVDNTGDVVGEEEPEPVGESSNADAVHGGRGLFRDFKNENKNHELINENSKLCCCSNVVIASQSSSLFVQQQISTGRGAAVVPDTKNPKQDNMCCPSPLAEVQRQVTDSSTTKNSEVPEQEELEEEEEKSEDGTTTTTTRKSKCRVSFAQQQQQQQTFSASFSNQTKGNVNDEEVPGSNAQMATATPWIFSNGYSDSHQQHHTTHATTRTSRAATPRAKRRFLSKRRKRYKPRSPSSSSSSHLQQQQQQQQQQQLPQQHPEPSEQVMMLPVPVSRTLKNRTCIFTVLIFLMGVLVSAGFVSVGYHAADREQSLKFQKQAADLVHSLHGALQDYVLAALWIQEACRSTSDQKSIIPATGNSNSTTTNATTSVVYSICSRQDFRELYEYLSAGGLEFTSMSYVPNVTHEYRSVWENEARTFYQTYYPNSTLARNYGGFLGRASPTTTIITTTGGSNQTKAVPEKGYAWGIRAEAPFYFPNHMIEPVEAFQHEENWWLVDYDMASVNHFQDLFRSLQTFQPILSSPMLSGYSNSTEFNYIMLFHPGVRLSKSFSPDESTSLDLDPKEYPHPDSYYQQDKSTGLSNLIVSFSSLLQRALSERSSTSISMYVFDTTHPDLRQQPALLGGVHIKPSSSSSSTNDDGTKRHLRRRRFLGTTENDSNEINRDEIDSAMDIDYVDIRVDMDSVLQGSSRDKRRLRHHQRIHVQSFQAEQQEWTVIVVTSDDAYRARIGLTLLGGCLLFVACACLAYWFDVKMRRETAIVQVKEAAAAEKAALIVDNAKLAARMERDLNDYMAHEVRNPLAAAISAASFLQTAHDDDTLVPDADRRAAVQDDIHVVAYSLQYINDLLRSMLDMHKVASQQLKLELSPTDIYRDVFEPVKTMLDQNNSKRRNVYDFVVECPEHLYVMSDRMRLKQILLNLANNAKKFVTKGFIRLRAQVVNGRVQISVEDSGPGIPLNKRQNIFNRFQESLDSLNQGTGMGLCLCKSMTELMEGNIWLDESFYSGIDDEFPGTRFVIDLNKPPLDLDFVNSNYGDDESSTFLVISHRGNRSTRQTPVPIVDTTLLHADDSEDADAKDNAAIDALPEPPAKTSISLLPEVYSVLVVDDDLTLRKMISRSIQRVAPTWSIQEAANGETALALVETQGFDLIFMDQYMASVEKQLLGTETVAAMRAKGVKSRICGLSANDLKDAFLQSGADAFLQKPIPCKKDSLIRSLLQLCNL